MSLIGTAPAPQAGSSDITRLLTDKFGTLPPGKRLFVATKEMSGGGVRA
jgi:hypothetical protein